MRSGLWQQNLKLVLKKKNYSKQHHDCPMSMGNKISVLWQLSTPGSLSGWLSHFGIMSTQWKAPLKFSQTQCTQNSASFMGPHNWSPIIPKVTSLSAGYQNNIGGFSTTCTSRLLKIWLHREKYLCVYENVWQASFLWTFSYSAKI